MKRGKILEGTHVYINVNNYSSLIGKEQKERNNVSRIIYLLSSYLSEIEYFIKELDSTGDNIYVEKLTESRIHIVFLEARDVDNVLLKISDFAYSIANYFDNEVHKFSHLDKLNIGIGADYGKFINSVFSKGSIEEDTSIGYPANRAAKLQSKAGSGELLISREVFERLSEDDQDLFNELTSERSDDLSDKYQGLKTFQYTFKKRNGYFEENDPSIGRVISKLENILQNKSFKDVNISGAKVKLEPTNLSLTNTKRLEAVVVKADIRGFTKKFNSDGSNLVEMSKVTTKVLGRLYDVTEENSGVHIQFQGDGELSIFHYYEGINNDYILLAILSCMSMIDVINDINDNPQTIMNILGTGKLAIGIGCAKGETYATRIGIRGQKDNLILGQSVRDADIAEDNIAGKNEIAITKDIYDHLTGELTNHKIKKVMKEIFLSRGEYYVCKVGLEEYREKYDGLRLKENHIDAKSDKSNRPWLNKL